MTRTDNYAFKKAAITERGMSERGYPKPLRRDEPWMSPLAADAARLKDMATGSDALLRALWRRHPRVMLVAKARGRQVRRSDMK